MAVSGIQLNDKNNIYSQACVFLGMDAPRPGDNTLRGQLLDLFWHDTLLYALEQNHWNFATRKEALILYQNTTCEYHKPASYVIGVGLGYHDQQCCRAIEHVNFREVNTHLELDYINSSNDCCCSCCEQHDTIFYITSDFSLAQASSTFRRYLTICLALNIAPRFRSDGNLLKYLEDNKEKTLREAIIIDNKESNRVKAVDMSNQSKCCTPFFRNGQGYIA